MRASILAKISIILFLGLSVFTVSCNYGTNKERDSTPGFDSILTKAENISDSGNKKEALAFINYAHAQAKGINTFDEMNYFTYIGEIYKKYFKDYDTYLACIDSMVLILEEKGYSDELSGKFIQAYNMKGDALFLKGLYNESYDYYYKAKALAQKTSDSCALSKFSYCLGMVLYRQQRFEEAAAHFKQSYNESMFCPDKFVFFYHRQELFDNIGLSYNGAKKYDSALMFYKKALNYIDSNYMRFSKNESVYITAKAVVYGNMGNAYISLNMLDTAKQLLEKSIAINLQKGYTNSDAILDQVKLAELCYNTGNIGEMSELLLKIRAELDSIPDKNVELSWHKLMWQYHDHQRDSVKAYRYARKYIAMNDTFLAHNKNLMATDLAGKIRSLERQNSINLLKKDNEQARVFLIVALLVAIMALTIVVLMLNNARGTKKNMAILSQLNNTVNEQNLQLEAALTKLEEKDRDKTRILRSVAHDVMNPIAAIMSLADILISESENYSEDHKEILELIKEACNNSLSLSKDIIQAAGSIDAASMEKEWVNINKLVGNSVKLLSIHAKAKKQKIILVSHTDDIKAFVNKKKIWRVINNLLGNAIKFSYENSEIEIHLVTVIDKVHISVIDHGVGIPEKNKTHVFDMFTEARMTGTSGESPHGLGLSISLQIAKAHNGNIWFESEEGRGTTFHVSLPLNSVKS